MNYTANHHLPQWSEADRVRMQDFNSAMAAIDSSITSAQSAAASAKSTASTASTNAAAAKSTANAALEKADAAYSPDNLPFVYGTYVGTGETQRVELGFYPSFVIVSGMRPSTSETSFESFVKYFAMSTRNSGQNIGTRLQTLPTSFIVYRVGNYGYVLPDLTEEGRTYEYVAFR